MKNRIYINDKIWIDLLKLIVSKLLVVANSGGGKSWLIRRIVEMAYGKVQIIIIDPEGEFSTLRERYDFILCGKGMDAPAESRSAGLLARKLLEGKTSAIIDLYELHPQERKRFVRLFFESMINAPKSLYNDCLVILDEAHIFAPEKGESEALSAVIGMASLGRKRGFSLVLATQRLSKLSKDAAAECNNKLIGRTSLDIDRKRAAEELGIMKKEEVLALRNLEPGEFFAFGPAISNEVIKLRVGAVNTSIPKAGRQTKVAPPSDKVKKELAALKDLPQEAEKEAKTVQELKEENRILKGNLSRLPQKIVENDPKAVEKAVSVAVREAITSRDKQWKDAYDSIWMVAYNSFTSGLDAIQRWRKPDVPIPVLQSQVAKAHTVPEKSFVLPESHVAKPLPDGEVREVKVNGGALRMLKVLVSRYPMKLTRAQLATFAKLKPSSGTYGTYLGTLLSGGYIVKEGDLLVATDTGLEFIGEAPNPPQTPEQVVSMWRENLSGGARRMFEYLVDMRGEEVTREQLGMSCDINPTSGTFGTYLGMLKSNGLIDVSGQNVRISENIFV